MKYKIKTYEVIRVFLFDKHSKLKDAARYYVALPGKEGLKFKQIRFPGSDCEGLGFDLLDTMKLFTIDVKYERVSKSHCEGYVLKEYGVIRLETKFTKYCKEDA